MDSMASASTQGLSSGGYNAGNMFVNFGSMMLNVCFVKFGETEDANNSCL